MPGRGSDRPRGLSVALRRIALLRGLVVAVVGCGVALGLVRQGRGLEAALVAVAAVALLVTVVVLRRR